jgi:hypothetical protein
MGFIVDHSPSGRGRSEGARFVTLVAALAATLAAVAMIPAQAGPLGDPDARTPAEPVYTVDLTSDANGFAWSGTESVTFTNVAAISLSEVWFRLWDNYASCGGSLAIRVTHMTGEPGPAVYGMHGVARHAAGAAGPG